jgi:hypothetical protein
MVGDAIWTIQRTEHLHACDEPGLEALYRYVHRGIFWWYPDLQSDYIRAYGAVARSLIGFMGQQVVCQPKEVYFPHRQAVVPWFCW